MHLPQRWPPAPTPCPKHTDACTRLRLHAAAAAAARASARAPCCNCSAPNNKCRQTPHRLVEFSAKRPCSACLLTPSPCSIAGQAQYCTGSDCLEGGDDRGAAAAAAAPAHAPCQRSHRVCGLLTRSRCGAAWSQQDACGCTRCHAALGRGTSRPWAAPQPILAGRAKQLMCGGRTRTHVTQRPPLPPPQMNCLPPD
jgi:hypothetical protein